MSDILDEVLQDHNDEKKLKFFKKLLPIIIVFALLVVFAMIVNNWLAAKKNDEEVKAGNILIQSVSALGNDRILALESLTNLAKSQDIKVKDLAMLEKINTAVDGQNYDEAKKLLEEVVLNRGFSNITKSYARIIFLSLVLDQERYNEREKALVLAYLQHFNDEKEVFFYTASLIKALWYIKNGQNELAIDVLHKISKIPEVPYIIKEQAHALLLSLEMKSN